VAAEAEDPALYTRAAVAVLQADTRVRCASDMQDRSLPTARLIK
jgi:hypothetical protein